MIVKTYNFIPNALKDSKARRKSLKKELQKNDLFNYFSQN
jgi:hypothetical protein